MAGTWSGAGRAQIFRDEGDIMRREIAADRLVGLASALSLALVASPALAEAPAPKIDAADTAWMISASGLVLMMTMPGSTTR